MVYKDIIQTPQGFCATELVFLAIMGPPLTGVAGNKWQTSEACYAENGEGGKCPNFTHLCYLQLGTQSAS